MIESELQRVYIYHNYARDSKIYLDKGSINIDNGSRGGTHWNCFTVKDSKSFNFDSLGEPPDKLLLNDFPKPKTYHNYKNQVINSQLCGSYSLYFFYLNERMNNSDAVLKKCFG